MGKTKLAIGAGLVIIIIASILLFRDSSNHIQSEPSTHDNEFEPAGNSRTWPATPGDSAGMELNRRKRPPAFRRPAGNWVCYALDDSVPVFDRGDQVIAFLSPGTFYKVLEDNRPWLRIELDSTHTGNISREEVRFTQANIPYVEQLLYAWTATRSDRYEHLIDQLPDTMMLKQRSDSGPRRPDEPLAFIKLVYKTKVLESRNEWRNLIDTWDMLVDRFPDKQVGDLPTSVKSKFEKANIYKTLQLPDSVIAMYESIMLANQDIEYNAPDLEGHYYADRWAFVKYIDYTSRLDIREEAVVSRLNRLFSGTSDFVKTLIKLQLNEVYFKRRESVQAMANFFSIIQGPPQIWHNFKTYGELRHAALFQMKNLSVEYFGSEQAINALDEAQSLTEDQDLIWLANYLKSRCYLELGDTLTARSRFLYCRSNPFQRRGNEISLSILPYRSEPSISKRKAIETVGDISERKM